MKLKIFSLLVILGVMSVTPMIYMGKFDPVSTINSVMSGDIEMPAGIEKIKASTVSSINKVAPAEKVQVYKWRDENGVMQFSNTPPQTGSAQSVQVDPNKNIIDAVKVPVKEEQKSASSTPVTAPSPYSVSGMKQVMDDAKGVEEMLQKRHEDQQKMLGNI